MTHHFVDDDPRLLPHLALKAAEVRVTRSRLVHRVVRYIEQDPRRLEFLSYSSDRTEKTFLNSRRSAAFGRGRTFDVTGLLGLNTSRVKSFSVVLINTRIHIWTVLSC